MVALVDACLVHILSQLYRYEDLVSSLDKKIDLLRAYIHRISNPAATSADSVYYIPSDCIDPASWKEFGNVYHVHSPLIFLNNSTRNVRLTLLPKQTI